MEVTPFAVKDMYRNKVPLILASGSPRRKEFLDNLGLKFIVAVAEIAEEPGQGESAGDFVQRMAREKALTVAKSHPGSWVIGGDTVVCLGDLILGKPASAKDAVELLMKLSGQSHTVRSCFCVCNLEKNIKRQQSVATRVQFAKFPQEVAEAYVATGEPMDKAGAYGIQGIGGALVETIDGSYSGVVGLPIVELVHVLEEEGVIEPASPGF